MEKTKAQRYQLAETVLVYSGSIILWALLILITYRGLTSH